MKIVIDIPEAVYKCVMDGTYCGTLYEELKNGVPVDTSGDCISREAAIQAVTHFDDTLKRLYELPSVEPERKTGKWHLLDECANEGWYCDQCHKKVFKADFSNTMRKYKFCPNCGAKMEVDG